MAYQVFLICPSNFEAKLFESILSFHGFSVIAGISSLEEAKLLISSIRPEVLIMELVDRNYLEFAKLVRKSNSRIGFVFLTPAYDLRLFNIKFSELPNATQLICKNTVENFETVISAIKNCKSRSRKTEWVNPPKYEQTFKLSDIQIETIKLIVSGATNKEIGKMRFVSEKAVEQMITRLGHLLEINAEGSQNLRVKLAAQYLNWTNGRK